MLWPMVLSGGALDRNEAFRQAAREIKHIERLRPRDKRQTKSSQPISTDAPSACDDAPPH
jgi:hypothetical protein